MKKTSSTILHVILLLILMHSVGWTESVLEQIQNEITSIVKKTRSNIVTVSVPISSEDSTVRSLLVTSGLIIDDSLVVTASNVVDQTKDVEISYSDRSQAPATVTGIDHISGIALLRVNGAIPDYSTPRPGSLPRVGDWVFLVTTSFEDIAGYCPGIVRAVRPAGLNGQVTTEIEASASPLPASAGAVLVNIHGDIVGVVVGRTGSDRTQSLNGPPSVPGILAVPLNEVLDISRKLARSGHVNRSWIGLSVQEMTPALRSILGVDPGNGAIVVHVEENSPASIAGLELGDVILSCQGRSIHSPGDVMGAVADISPGTSIEFGILRNDEIFVLPLEPAPLSISNPANFEQDGKTRGTRSRIESLERELKRLKESLQ